MKKIFTILSAMMLLQYAHAQTIDFEDVLVPGIGFWKGQAAAPAISGFQSGPGYFVNAWDTSWGGVWSGFGYSDLKDSVSINYATNELASIAAGGNNNSNNYAVAYRSFDPSVNVIRLPKYYMMGSVYLTNTTIAYRSMQNGDGFAKKFGGVSGNDSDFFKIRFTGWLNGIAKTDTVDFYLADFRDSNNTNDYIIKEWTLCNLSPLGYCDSLTYMLSSSDTGAFGMNTPAYFCMDDWSMIFVGINELSQQKEIEAYPNPFQDNLIIRNGSGTTIHVDLFNIEGKVLRTAQINPHDKNILTVSSLSKGTYMIRVKVEDQIYYQKLQK